MSRARRISGKRSKRNGQNFEKLIERTCEHYRRKGIANINKTPEPLKPLAPLNNGQFRAVYAKKGQPDFLGTIVGGKSIIMEAKHTNGTNIRFDRISLHQERELEGTHRLGGIAVVLISFSMKNFYSVPWVNWKDMKYTIGKKSVNKKDLADYKLDTKNGYLHFLD